MNDFRVKGEELAQKHKKNKLSFDESTYYFSSVEKEQNFINAQFPTPELKEKYQEELGRHF